MYARVVGEHTVADVRVSRVFYNKLTYWVTPDPWTPLAMQLYAAAFNYTWVVHAQH